LNPHF